jgi:hypothetical protein
MLGVDLLHTAVIDSRLGAVVLDGSLVSFETVARASIHRDIFEAVVPGVLGRYDLPDLAAALAPRRVWLLNLRTPAGAPMFQKDVERTYAKAAAKPESRVYARGRREGEGILDVCPELQ